MKKKYNSASIEAQYQSFWKENQVYKYDSSKSREETFVIDTPPPTVSGSLHIGHVFSYTQTDVLARFQRMKGKNIFYPMGWDDNGLPTERRIQKLYGITCDPSKDYEENLETPLLSETKNKSTLPETENKSSASTLPETKKSKSKSKSSMPLVKVSRKKFLEICHKQVLEDEKIYQKLWSHLGLSVDWNQTYETIGAHVQKISQQSFLDLYQKDLVENHFSPVLWDVTFQTAVAQADIEDRPKKGYYHDIRFQVQGGGDFVISTTRPELLAACIAVAAHPTDKRYQKFFNKKAITPLFEMEVPIIASEHADPEKGTGILMICTFGDIEDVRFWKKHSLDLKMIINKQGRLHEVDFSQSPFKSFNPKKAQTYYQEIIGLKAYQARAKMPELLEQEKVLAAPLKEKEQFVKYYEKGDLPLEFMATRQWFVKILDYKKELLEYGKKVQWHPASFYKRYEQWVENLNQDWCISRQRFFGVPFPVWYPLLKDSSVDYQNPIIATAKDLPVDPIKQTPPNYSESQRGQANGFIAEQDVMDTWASSSLTPFINSHWKDDEVRHQKLFPADLRPQAHEIIRTWAFYTIAKSYFHEKSIPWKNIAISGWVITPDKNKMSKSKGNIVTPEKLIETYSADALRYWAAKARLGQDSLYEEKVFKVGQRLVTKVFNASKFIQIQLEGREFQSTQWETLAQKITNPIDQAWIISLEESLKKASQELEGFHYAPALDHIEKRFWLFCDNYIELTKSRAYQLKDKPDGLSAICTLDYSLYLFIKMLAPYLPYITEEIWSWRYKTESQSIHQSLWPKDLYSSNFLKNSVNQLNLQDILDLAFQLLEQIRNFKASQQKSLVTPVKAISIGLNKKQQELFEHCKQDILYAAHIPEEALSIVSTQGSSEISLKIEL